MIDAMLTRMKPWNKGLTKLTSPSLARLAKQKSDWWKNNDTTETRRKIGVASKAREFPVGDKHPSWKGGRIVSKRDGYVLVIAPVGHPFAKSGGGGNKQKYILEHRLVMEGVVGRYLEKDED